MGAWLLTLALVSAVQQIAKEGQALSLRSLVNIATMVNNPKAMGNDTLQDETYGRILSSLIQGANIWEREHASPGKILELITDEADSLLEQVEKSPLFQPLKPWQVMSEREAAKIGGRATTTSSLLEMRAHSKAKWPDQILPNIAQMASEIRQSYQDIMQQGRKMDLEGVRRFAQVERGLQKKIEDVKREMEENRGKLDSTTALVTVMQETKSKVQTTIMQDKAIIIGVIGMIEKSYYDNNCILKTGLLFQGEECPKEYPGAQVYAAHQLAEYAEELQEELLDDFDDEKKKVEEKKAQMQKDCASGVTMIQKYSDAQKEAVEDSLETRRMASDAKVIEGKDMLNRASILSKTAMKDTEKLEPFLNKMTGAHEKDVARSQTEVDRTKERTINAIMKMAEAGFKGLDVSSMGMLSTLVKNYAAGDKELADGGATLEKAIAEKYDEMVEQIQEQTDALGDGPAGLAKNLEKIQSGAMVKGFGEATSIGQKLKKTEQDNNAYLVKAGNTVDGLSQSPLPSAAFAKTTEDVEAAKLVGTTSEAESDMKSKVDAFLKDASTFADLSAEDQEKLIEHLLANGMTLEEIMSKFGEDGGEALSAKLIEMATKKYVEQYTENAKTSREQMQKSYELAIPEALENAQSEANSDHDEAKQAVQQLAGRDLTQMGQEIVRAKGRLDDQARQAVGDLQDLSSQIVKDTNAMTVATRETQDKASKADQALVSFEQNDLNPWKTSAMMAAQGLGRQATEATSRLRSDLNRKLQSAKGQTTLAAANLAKDTEQFLAAKKALLQKDDQETRTAFTQMKVQFEDDAKAAVMKSLEAAEVKIKHAAAMVPNADKRYKDAQDKVKDIVEKLNGIHAEDIESLAQASKDQFHELLSKTVSEALEDMTDGEDGFTATAGKKQNAAYDAVNQEATETEDAAHKLKTALVNQFKALLRSQETIHGHIKQLGSEGDSHQEEMLTLLAALSETAGETSSQTKLSLADFDEKMKADFGQLSNEIQPRLDAVLSSANPVFEQVMAGVMSQLDAHTQNAARKYASLATDIANKEKALKDAHTMMTGLMDSSGNNLEQFLKHSGEYTKEVAAKIADLLGVDLNSGTEAADSQRRQADQAKDAAFGMMNGIDKMWSGAAKNDINARLKSSENMVNGEFQAASQAEKEAEAESAADRERKKAALAEAADSFSNHVEEANAKWTEIQGTWRNMNQANQAQAQSLTSQGRQLIPAIVDEAARLKVRRNEMVKEFVGLLAGLFQITFNGAQAMQDEAIAHTKESMQYVNKLANVEGTEAIKILQKLKRAHDLATAGNDETLGLLEDAKAYAELDTKWRHEVVKAFVKLNEKDGTNQDAILAKIKALNQTIIDDVSNERKQDQGEIEQSSEQLRKEADAEGQRTKEELQYMAGQEAQRGQATDQRLKDGQDAANGALDSAGADLDDLESQLGALSKNAGSVDATLGKIKAGEKAKQDDIQAKVEQERNAVQRKMAQIAAGGDISSGGASAGASTDDNNDDDATDNSDGDADIFADDGSTDGGSTDGGSTDGGSTDGGSTDGGSADGGSADGGSSFLQLRRGQLDGNKVMALIEDGVPEEEVAKLLMERHRALVAKSNQVKLDKLEQYRKDQR